MTETTEEQNYDTPKLHMYMLYYLTSEIIKCFEKNHIKYWIDGGSLLGAVREKPAGIIKHDDDVDLAVENKYWKKVYSALDEHFENLVLRRGENTEYRMIVEETSKSLIKVFIPDLWVKIIENGRIIGTPTIDIFRYVINNDDMMELYNEKDRELYKNCYHKLDDLFPLKNYQFGNFTVKGPNNPMPYLYRYYGEDCMDNIKVDLRKEDDPKFKN